MSESQIVIMIDNDNNIRVLTNKPVDVLIVDLDTRYFDDHELTEQTIDGEDKLTFTGTLKAIIDPTQIAKMFQKFWD